MLPKLIFAFATSLMASALAAPVALTAEDAVTRITGPTTYQGNCISKWKINGEGGVPRDCSTGFELMSTEGDYGIFYFASEGGRQSVAYYVEKVGKRLKTGERLFNVISTTVKIKGEPVAVDAISGKCSSFEKPSPENGLMILACFANLKTEDPSSSMQVSSAVFRD
jgi:hypothetical protein